MKERMINYLLRETRYTRSILEALDDKTLERWYKEEKEVNKEESIYRQILDTSYMRSNKEEEPV